MIKQNNVGGYDVENFSFPEFETDEASSTFEFKELERSSGFIDDKVIRQERKDAQNTQFKIAPVVQQYRGILDQEKSDYLESVENEVNKRLALLKQKAYEEGYKTGEEQGRTHAYEEAKINFEEKLMTLEADLQELRIKKNDVLEEYRDEIYKVIKNLVKWIILKEVKEDSYLPALFEKLILELNERNNLLIKVNAENYNEFEDVIENVEKKLGELRNTRIEILRDAKHSGIIVESENSIIDGSIEAQFNTLDKLFDLLGGE